MKLKYTSVLVSAVDILAKVGEGEGWTVLIVIVVILVFKLDPGNSLFKCLLLGFDAS